MNYTNIIGKVITLPTKEFFDDNIIIHAIFMELPQISSIKFSQSLRVAIWEDFRKPISQLFEVGDYFLVDGYVTLREDVTEFEEEIDSYFEFTIMNYSKLIKNKLFSNNDLNSIL
jgi:hypothetical protein